MRGRSDEHEPIVDVTHAPDPAFFSDLLVGDDAHRCIVHAMSKAFTKEDDAAPPELPLPPRPREPLPITRAGLMRLRAERADLSQQGLSDSFRARVLDGIFDSVVETPPALRDGGVGFGCQVELARDDHTHIRYTLVGPDEADPSRGLISVVSPVARALLGKRVGDHAVLSRPRGDEDVHVVRVSVASNPDQG